AEPPAGYSRVPIEPKPEERAAAGRADRAGDCSHEAGTRSRYESAKGCTDDRAQAAECESGGLLTFAI
ncbi:MAG: hypothetical protein ACR652_25055, partial [Methylocystis sp.]|uniref:hypothetical protein n=1 Tax=Methylocystis sp. TaxID=1911079 RepID=UPI003DA29DDE